MSKKEIKDANEDNESVDMTRAKILKSFYRIIDPLVGIKNIPIFQVMHTYQCGTGDMEIMTPNGTITLKEIKKGDEE